MWIKNSKNGEWINLMHVMRISNDGQGGYIVAMSDGIKSNITKEDYEAVQKFIGGDIPHQGKLDLEKEIMEIKEMLKGKNKKEGDE